MDIRDYFYLAFVFAVGGIIGYVFGLSEAVNILSEFETMKTSGVL